MHTLFELLGSFPIEPLSENHAHTPIKSLVTDSRKGSNGCLFFAIPGAHADGHDFIPQLIGAGASAVVYEREIPLAVKQVAREQNVALVRVEHARQVLSYASAVWFGKPSEALTNIGVTGTDGKSSTVYFIHQLLEAAGIQSGFFSTVAMQTADVVVPNGMRQSTPEAPDLHEVLAAMRNVGKTHAVIESTSHGLSFRTSRLRDVHFQVAVFTNLSHEHIEFHGSYEQYRNDKANLFRDLQFSVAHKSPTHPFAVVNRSDNEAAFFSAASKFPILSYSMARDGIAPPLATLVAQDVVGVGDSCTCILRYDPTQIVGSGIEPFGPAATARMTIPLPGTFNIENVMAALLVVSVLLGKSPLSLLPFVSILKGVRGRMVPIRKGQDFSLVIDYAHTPGAYQRILPLFRASTTGKLIAVFGSAGERDIEKRGLQGQLAARYCDVIVLTNEDPRLEDENKIIEEIRAGVLAVDSGKPVYCIPDRKMAIARACSLAGTGDTVILLGKGHEQSIFKADGKHSWDEETVATEVLVEQGWNG